MNTLKITVRSSTQQVGDYVVEADPCWTVEEMKLYLQANHPKAPDAKSQKLIYMGRLLNDKDVKLNEIVMADHETHIFHMVHQCSGTLAAQIPPRSLKDDETFTRPHPDGSNQRPTLRQRNVPNFQSRPATTPLQMHAQVPLMGGVGAALNANQMVTMQAMYANYWQAYMQQLQEFQGTGQAQYLVNNDVNVGTEADTNQVPQDAPRENEVPPARDPVVVLDAQGRVVNEEDNNGGENLIPRDWLDLTYTIFRASILLAIVSFYSTVSRFTVALFVTVLLYVVHTMRNGGAANQEDAANENEVPQAPPQPHDAEAENQENNAEPDRNSADDQEQNAPEIEVQQQAGFFGVLSTFIITFVTSLFPEPQRVA